MPRQPYSPPPPKGVKVQQHHAAGNSAADIMRKHLKGPNRLLPPGNPAASIQPRFEAMPSMSYHEMLNKVSGIKSTFERLPSQLRQRFGNDPKNMLAFLDDPKNRKEAVRLGMVPMNDEEYLEISAEAEAARIQRLREMGFPPLFGQGLQEPQEPAEGSPRPDPESQPSYAPRPPQGAQKPPKKGGTGGQ